MKRQVLKMTDGIGCFTVIHDDTKEDKSYTLYEYTWSPNKYGVYGRHGKMISRRDTISACLAEIMDAIRPTEEKLYWARKLS